MEWYGGKFKVANIQSMLLLNNLQNNMDVLRIYDEQNMLVIVTASVSR